MVCVNSPVAGIVVTVLVTAQKLVKIVNKIVVAVQLGIPAH